MESKPNSNVINFENTSERKRKIKDILKVFSTYLFSSFSIVALIAIVAFIFSKGWSTLSWNFITGDYQSELWNVSTSSNISEDGTREFAYEPNDGEYFSYNWGIAFVDSTDNEGNSAVEISYVDPNANIDTWVDSSSGDPFTLQIGMQISSAQMWTNEDPNLAQVKIVSSSTGAERTAEIFDQCPYMHTMTLVKGGQGMRGSLISTLWMILITMCVALPLGIGGAIYLGVYAKASRLTSVIRTMIDMISGIPSIVFGLVGGIIFLPIVGGQGNIISGALTLACMILPIIIKSTEEAIRAIPQNMINASLALGASQTQTTFKIILPNSIGGIFTATLLGIGRVIGESAALIYTSGTIIQDYIIPTQGSATLAVHIWKLMSGENQNFEASCAIAIVILFIILILSVAVKLIAFKTDKFKKAR